MEFGLGSFNLINEFKRAFYRAELRTNHEPFSSVTPLEIVSLFIPIEDRGPRMTHTLDIFYSRPSLGAPAHFQVTISCYTPALNESINDWYLSQIGEPNLKHRSGK